MKGSFFLSTTTTTTMTTDETSKLSSPKTHMAPTTTLAKSKKGVVVLVALCMLFFYTGRRSSSSGGGGTFTTTRMRGGGTTATTVLATAVTGTQEELSTSCDLIYSNAALHWLPALQLQPVLTKLYTDCLKPGGILAFQIPDSRLQPSHLVLDELVAATVDDLDDFVFSSSFRTVRVPRNEVDMEVYHTLFSSLMDNNNKNNNGDGKSCDSNRTNNTKDDTTTKHDKNNSSSNNIAIWTTTYLHPLPYYASASASTAAASTSRRTTTTSTNTTQNNSSNHHPHPVYDFYASTGLGPFLEACIDEQEKETFITRYNQRMFDCYPVVFDTAADHKSSSGTQKKDDGTVFLEVTRLFVTVRKPEEKGRQ